MENIRSKIEQILLMPDWRNIQYGKELNNTIEKIVDHILNALGICGSCGQNIRKGK